MAACAKKRAPLWQQWASTVRGEPQRARATQRAAPRCDVLQCAVLCCNHCVGVACLTVNLTVPGEPQERAQRHLELVRVPPRRAAAARVLAARGRPRLRRRQSDGQLTAFAIHTTTCGLDALVAQRRLCKPSPPLALRRISAPSSTRVPAAPWNRSPNRSFSLPFCFARA
jgi:hypothetical protein